MNRKLITVYQEHSIICDNIKCDYKIKNTSGDPNEDISGYLNMPCPKCGENLLTEQDYLRSMKVMRIINWINKWFSWVMFLVPKKTKVYNATIDFHDKIKIDVKK